jgi:plastocyanin
MPRRRPSKTPLLVALVAAACAGSPAAAAHGQSRPQVQPDPAPRAGVRHLHFAFGPVPVTPGQNTIDLDATRKLPKGDGWITSFKPNLVRAGGRVPPVDVLHLHHAVWIVDGRLTWAAGEEKTAIRLPRGFGWRHRPGDRWVVNHMIHNLTASPDRVWITWDVDLVPKGSPAARGMRAVDTQWLDVQAGRAYPVFDVLRGSGRDGRITYPDDVPGAYAADGVVRNRWIAGRDTTLAAAAGHLHPGGLYTDLDLARGGRTVRRFRARAHYFEPAGPVSWDVAMTASPPDWRVRVRRGDVLTVHGTYDTRRGSWYEAMAIMPVAATVRPAGGADPFARRVDVRGVLTHGHLPENDNHGGSKAPYRSPAALPDGPRLSEVTVGGFLYGQGDLSVPDAGALPPVVAPGRPLTFVNADAGRNIFHTITGCRLPCTGRTGIAFPLADGAVFDSGELGLGPAGFTAAANRVTWQTPASLAAGTYAFFCRVHPFMRGAFRVKA